MNLFADLEPVEAHKLFTSMLAASKEKQPKAFSADEGELSEGYRFLAGEIRANELKYGVYCNLWFPAYKSFNPKFMSRQPSWMYRSVDRNLDGLAASLQELSQWRVQRFDYTAETSLIILDAMMLGIGYGRHAWDDELGVTTTTRFDPRNIFWDAQASSIRKAAHVMEKHTLKRWEFEKKFGKDVADEIDSDRSPEGVAWPKDRPKEERNPLDEIDYYLMWSKHGGERRVYAFHKSYHDTWLTETDGEPGEPWPVSSTRDSWHLTPMVLTPINGRIEGISMWSVARGQYIAFQNLLGAATHAGLQSCKKLLFVPNSLADEAEEIEESGETLKVVRYNRDDTNEQKITDMIELVEMPKVSDDLLRMLADFKAQWEEIVGVNSVSQLNPQGVETAAEAMKLGDAAANRIADDQGVVERWMMEIGRKESRTDLLRMPKLSTVCAKPKGYEKPPAGEFAEEKPVGPMYFDNIPYQDAVLLENGIEDEEAAKSAEADVERVRRRASMKAMMQAEQMGGAMMNGQPPAAPPEPRQAGEAAVMQMPLTPEMAVRAKYRIPFDAEVTITNPGIAQFIGEEKAAGWIEGLSERQIEMGIAVTIQPGSSSAMGRMQKVQEVMMLFNTLMPWLQAYGIYEPMVELVNAAIDAAEIASLERAKVSLQQVLDAVQRQQQAAQAEAAAKEQAKAAASQGPQTLTPDVDRKASAEESKATAGIVTAREKTKQATIKATDNARNREQNMAQLVLGPAMGGVPGRG